MYAIRSYYGNWLQRFRRMLGLYAFFYTFLHFLVWLILDQGVLWSAIVEDVVKRPFITIGFAALLILAAMAVTSTNGMRRITSYNVCYTKLLRGE